MTMDARVKHLIANARKAELQLRSDGHGVEAQAVTDLINSRTMSVATNSRLWHDNVQLRALLRRAHDAMSRREPDGVSEAEWDALLADMGKEVGVGNG